MEIGEDIMEIIFTDDRNYQLLYRYSKYYIRFEAGDMMPIPCDYEITEAEKEAVFAGTTSMSQLLSENARNIPWTEKEFMRRGFTEFFKALNNCSDEDIENYLEKLSLNNALRIEMYYAIMDEKFPVNCRAKVNEKTAMDYSKELGLDYAGTYMYMVKNC